jgi:Transcriptional regulators
MSTLTDNLMKQLRFVSEAGNFFMHQKRQKLTGQQRVLAILKLEDGLTQSYLAEILDLRPSSLAELLKKMETNGDIIRTEDEADKRSKHVNLTESGRDKAEKNASYKNEDYNEIFFKGLNDDEKKQFSKYLEKISDGWDEDFQKQASRFVDPTDRIKAMQEMRDSMFDMRQDMSPEEIKELRAKMKHAMKDMPFNGGHCRPDFRRFEGDFGHGRGPRRQDFRFDNRF